MSVSVNSVFTGSLKQAVKNRTEMEISVNLIIFFMIMIE